MPTTKKKQDPTPEAEPAPEPKLTVVHPPKTETVATPKKPDDGPNLTGVEMVRAALLAGMDKPKDGVAWILDTYGVEMKTNTFSVNKNTLRKRGGDKGEDSHPKKTRKARSSATTTATKGTGNGGSGNGPTQGNNEMLWRLMKEMNYMIQGYGKENVKRAVEVLTVEM